MEQTKIYQTMMSLLSRHTRPDEKLVRALHPLVKQRVYEAKDVFISKGEIPSRLAYICAGAAVAYKYDDDNRRLVGLWKEEEVMMDTANMLKPKKSDLDIIFIANSEVMEISIKELYKFQQEHEEIKPYLGYFLSSDFTKLIDYICWLKTTIGKSRIQDFQQNYRLHNMLLPDEQKAQFLNMGLRWYQANK